MTNSLAAATRLQLAFTLVVLSQVAAAQSNGSVQESRPVILGGQSQSAPAASSNNNDGLTLLLEQNRQLSSEVQALRNLIEEQGFELRKLQRDSLSRYTNVDQRLSNLETSATSVSATPARSIGNSAAAGTDPLAAAPSNSASIGMPRTSESASTINTSSPSRPDTASTAAPTSSAPPSRVLGGGSTLQPAVLSEQQLYQMAYDSVINSNFELSIAEFDQYLSIYPQGRFVTNAHYWKGQAYLYLSRFEEARTAYEIILNQYSDSPKLPDAMYGLGLAYQGLGNIPQARQLLNDIKRRFPNTGVANLADTRLLSLD